MSRTAGKKRAAWVIAVAGIAIVSPAVLAVAAKKWPKSPAGSLQNLIHNAEATSS